MWQIQRLWPDHTDDLARLFAKMPAEPWALSPWWVVCVQSHIRICYAPVQRVAEAGQVGGAPCGNLAKLLQQQRLAQRGRRQIMPLNPALREALVCSRSTTIGSVLTHDSLQHSGTGAQLQIPCALTYSVDVN